MFGWAIGGGIEHPSGYHGHYQKDIQQLVNKEDIDQLTTNIESNHPIFDKFYDATRRLEQTLISSKDFVNNNDGDEGKRGVVDEVYLRSSHHGGEDFKRCDLLFTPVVNSIMMTCATEESGKRIKSLKLKSNPQSTATKEVTSTIPFAELESEMRKLQQKRFKVKHLDKKNHRTNAIPSKATFELKQLLEKTENDPSTAPSIASLLMTPTESPRPSSRSIKKTNTINPSTNQHESTTPRLPPPSLSQSQSPRPRRPKTSQPSRYLASTRKVQFSSTDPNSQQESTKTTGQGSNPSTHKKKLLVRDESRGIDNSMLQDSDDSSGDDNEVFDTFNMKGVYRLQKRRALMGSSPDKIIEKPSQPSLRRSPTILRQTSIQPTPQYTIPPSITLSEKEAYSAKIATQFLSNVLKKKPITSALPDNPPLVLTADHGIGGDSTELDLPEEEEIQPELIRHLFPTQHQEENDLSKKRIANQSQLDKIIQNSKSKNKSIKFITPQPPQSQPQPSQPPHLHSQTQAQSRRAVHTTNSSTQQEKVEEKSEESPNQWLEKRMKALLADYQAGEKKHDQSLHVDEETRKLFEARTISIEISLLFRGFQTIDKTSDGFLSCQDIFTFCNTNPKHDHHPDAGLGTFHESSAPILSKSEINNVLWLMDDNRRGSLTFDDIIKFYLRKRKEFLDSSEEYKLRIPVAPEELVKMRLHQEHDVVTECDLLSQPLLLFRILFFVAMQDSRGEVHLLTAFQNLSQLFGRAAEDQFNCIFLKNCLDIRDEDRQSLQEFVTYLKLFRVRIQRKKLVMREFSEKKAALVHFSYNKDHGTTLIDERRNARGDIAEELTKFRTQQYLNNKES